MTRARRRALLGLFVAFVAAVFLAGTYWQRKSGGGAKPQVMLLTSLPIIFGEDFDPRGQGSPTLTALSETFDVRPISTSSATELSKGRLLLMAQPPAQSPQDLVALDAWVRRGGRVLVLADPMLEWPSARPLGDPLHPPIMFTDTGLLAHWGLRLDPPDARGPAKRALAGRDVIAVSPGAIEGACNIGSDGFVAVCRIGNGRAIVVADADFLNAEPGSPALAAVTDVLAWLSGNDSQRTDLSTGVAARTS